jgi:hypothetical protein
MRVLISIDTDNAAFEGNNLGLELAHILRGLVSAYEDGAPPEPVKLRDSNGNTAGKVTIKQED